VGHPLRVRRGWLNASVPDGAVRVHRRTRWGNPFRVEDHGQERAVALYERWLLGNADLLAQLPGLKGKRLACYCTLDEPCHADVLARLANEVPPPGNRAQVSLGGDHETAPAPRERPGA
jgi:Domain of unknown function (DUF4326)